MLGAHDDNPTVRRLRAAVAHFARDAEQRGAQIDPRVVLLLVDDDDAGLDDDDAIGSDRPAVLPPPSRGSQPPPSHVHSLGCADAHRRAAARERKAAQRAGVSVEVFRAQRGNGPAAAVAPVTLSRVTAPEGHAPSEAVTPEPCDGHAELRDMSRSAPARAGFTSSALASFGDSAVSVSPDPASSSSSLSGSAEHNLKGNLLARDDSATVPFVTLSGDRAALPPPPPATDYASSAPLAAWDPWGGDDAAPETTEAPALPRADAALVGARHRADTTGDGGGKRTDRATWGLVDRLARVHYDTLAVHPSWAPKNQSAVEPVSHHRVRMYDGCQRALAMAYELIPTAPIGERFELAVEAYERHVRNGRPWTGWSEPRDVVRAAQKARVREAEEKMRASPPVPDAERKKQADALAAFLGKKKASNG